ncbi:unnamed protein product [Victoria cruziana]
MALGYACVMWKSRIGSAFRTGWACVMVGLAIEFYNARLHHPMDFQPFAYLTATLIIGEACLGEAMQGAALALYGIVQGACPAFLILWMMGPSSLSACTVTLVVTVSGFVVSLPKSTHIVAKRVALGQIVIVYVADFMHRRRGTDASVYPLHAALSTAVGAGASILALLLPVPRLACHKIKEKTQLIGEISYGMLKLLAGVYSAESISSAIASLSHARTLGDARAQLITTVRHKQEIIGWEKPLVGCLIPNFKALLEKFLSLEKPIKGMEIALCSSPLFPTNGSMGDKEIKDLSSAMAERIGQSIETIMVSAPKDSRQVQDDDSQPLELLFEALGSASPTSSTDLPPIFFLFCMKNLYEGIVMPQKQQEITTNIPKNGTPTKKGKGSWPIRIDTESLLMAVKCSISLGLSVLFGILFTDDNGYWGGLAVAVSIASQREPTFKMANIRTQGTVLGSVYGVLGCFFTQKFVYMRYIALIPWVVFTSFIRQSEMYGYVGGLTAFIGAIVILGRRDYGSPSEFAIERITETFVGILCCIIVELVFLPRRASTLAREKLLKTLADISDCISLICSTNKPCLSFSEMKEAGTRLRTNSSELKNLIEEAKAEPDFWFIPFPHASYSQVVGSLSTIIELVNFLVDTLNSLPQVSCVHMISRIEMYKAISEDLEEFKDCILSHLICFQEVLRAKALKGMSEECLKKNEGHYDPEAGEADVVDGNVIDKVIESFVRHMGDVVAHVEGMKEMKVQMVLGLGATGFCLAKIMNESKTIECGIQEILQSETPLAHVNLWDIRHMLMQVKSSRRGYSYSNFNCNYLVPPQEPTQMN